jgi:hypothetical protein
MSLSSPATEDRAPITVQPCDAHNLPPMGQAR